MNFESMHVAPLHICPYYIYICGCPVSSPRLEELTPCNTQCPHRHTGGCKVMPAVYLRRLKTPIGHTAKLPSGQAKI